MVKLIPMTAQEYQNYLDFAVKDYAAEKVASGNWSEGEAEAKSRADFASLLPDGVETADHFLFSIQDDTHGEHLGVLWLGRNPYSPPGHLFVYSLWILAEHRRKGYGEAAMLAAEGVAKEKGYHELDLHVFGHNHAARALYTRLGYAETNVNMSKKLG